MKKPSKTRSLDQGRDGRHLRRADRYDHSVQPDGDSWKVTVMQEGSPDDVDRREMGEQIAARLKGEFDLKG